MHRALSLLMLLLIVLSGCQGDTEKASPAMVPVAADSASAPSSGTRSIFDTEEMMGLIADRDGIRLAPNRREGHLLSDPYPADAFDRLVASWDILLPAGSGVDVFVQVSDGESWSGFYPLGSWSETPRSHSYSDERGYVDIDVLSLSRPHSQLRFRLDFKASDASPSLRDLSWTTWLDGERLYQPPRSENIFLSVAPRSQFSEGADIASEICSPTCLAMLLQHYDLPRDTREVAAGVYDHAEQLYGNWSFAAAYAASQGLPLHIRYLDDWAPLLASLRAGHPVICSIAFAPQQLSGSPIGSSPGHLVLVCGYELREGVPMFLVNDPAAPDTAGVARAYRADQFFAAWNGIAYLVDAARLPAK